MIAARFAGACWVAAALAVATYVAVSVRSPSTARRDNHREWYVHELERAGDRVGAIRYKLDVIDRDLRDLERDEAGRPMLDVEREAERLYAERDALREELGRGSSHCTVDRITREGELVRLDREYGEITARLAELDRMPGPHTVKRVRLRRELAAVSHVREYWERKPVDGPLRLD